MIGVCRTVCVLHRQFFFQSPTLVEAFFWSHATVIDDLPALLLFAVPGPLTNAKKEGGGWYRALRYHCKGIWLEETTVHGLCCANVCLYVRVLACEALKIGLRRNTTRSDMRVDEFRLSDAIAHDSREENFATAFFVIVVLMISRLFSSALPNLSN